MQLKKNKILVCCDGSAKYGYGHIKRSKALFESLLKKGFRAQLIIISEVNQLKLELVLKQEIREGIVIFDLPYHLDNLILQCKNSGLLTVTLDYFGKISPHINIVVFEHKIIKTTYQKHIGFRFVIIRNEILEVKNKINSYKSLSYVLVLIGGGDINNEGVKAAELLAHNGYRVKLISGPYSKYPSNPKLYTLYKQPKHLPELLLNANFIISNGGGTLFESIYLEKNVFVLPQTKFEENICDYFLDNKIILGCGFKNLNLFLEKKELTQTIKYKTVIDGFGLDRIIDLIDHNTIK